MTTLRPFRRMRQSVAFISLAAMLSSQVYLSAADYYLIRRGDGLNSIYSYAETAFPLGLGDTLVMNNLTDGAVSLNSVANGTLGGLVSVGGLRVLNPGGALTILPNSTVGGTQTIQIGAGGIDMSAATQNVTFQKINGGGTLALQLAAAQSWLIGTGRTLTMQADVAGSSQLTVNTLGSGALTMSGALNLSAPLVVNAQGSGAIAFSGAVGMNGNAINISNASTSTITYSGAISNASAINFTNSSTGKLVLSGPLSSTTGTAINLTNFGGGAADLTGAIGGASTTVDIVNFGTATTLMQGNNTYGGATTLTGGTINLKYDVAASGTTPSSNASKLSDTAALTLNRASVTMTTAATGTLEEVVGSLVIGSGYSQITRSAATGGLIANTITRSSGGVLNVGAAGIMKTDNTNINGILGGWATTGAGANWVFNATNGADGLVNTYTGYTSQTNPASWAATQNILIGGSTTAAMGTNTINSIKIDAAAATTVSQTAGTTWTIDSGGILSVGAGTKAIGTSGAFITAGTLANAAAQRAGAANSELFFHVTTGAVTLNSTIIDNASLTGSPSVGLTKTQGGSLILASDNAYTGVTTIAGGTLQLGVGVSGGATGNVGAGDIVNHGTLLFNRSNDLTLNNNISGIGGLTQNIATSTITLAGINTYRGSTSVTKGVIRAGSSSGFSSGSTFAMGTDASARLRLNGFDVEIGGLTGGSAAGGAVELGSKTLTVGGLGFTQTYSGIMSGVGGSLIKVGSGTFTMGSANTFTGSVTVQAGGLVLPGNNNLAALTVNAGSATMAGNNTFGGLVSIVGGTATMAGNNTFNGGLTIGPAGTITLNGNNSFNGAVTFNQNAVTTLGAATTNTFQAVNINAGSVVMNGAVNNITALNINGGSLTVGRVGGVIPDNLPVSMGGSGSFLIFNESETVGSISGSYGSQVVVASGKTLDIGTGGLSSIFNGALTGLGNVTKTGSGDFQLGGGNSFSGAFNINGGSVTLTPDTPVIFRPEMISDTSAVTIASGSSLNLLGRTETVGSVAGAGNIDLGAGGHFMFGGNGASTTISGVISGTGEGSVSKLGAGTATLTGANTFTGLLEVSGGVLHLDHAAGNALDDSMSVFMRQAGAVLHVGSAGEVVGPVTGSAGSLLQLDGQLVSTNVPGSNIAVVGTATAGSPLWTGGDTNAALPLRVGMKITNSNFVTDPSWVVQISGSDSILLSNPAQSPGGVGTLNFTPVSMLASNTSGTGGFTKNGNGTLVLVGHQTHSGDTVINAGEVQLGGFESGGRFVWQNVFSDNSQLVFGSTGTQIVNMAASASNLFTFERIGSLAGGAGATSSLNLVENSQLGTPTSANIGTLAFGGDNKSSTFFGTIDGQDAAARVWAIKEGTGTFSYLNNFQSFRGVARVEDGTWRIPAGVGSIGLNQFGVSLYLSNKSGAVFDNEITEEVDILAGGAGVRSLNRAGITGALMGNYLNQSGGEVKLTGAFSELYVSNATLPSMSFAGQITGSGSLVKTGSSALLLLNENTYTGSTRVEGGSLQLGYLSRTEGVGNAVITERRGSLSAGTTITLSNGATMNTNSLDTLAANITTGGSAQSITLGRGTLTLTNASGNYRGLLNSGGGLAQTGAGLSGIGLVRVTGGTLTLAGTGQVNGPRLELTNSAHVVLDNGNGSSGAALADDTLVHLADTSVMEFGSNSNGEIFGSLRGSGTVDLGADRSITLTRPGGDSLGVFSGTITGTGTSGLILEGRGALVLSGTNTYVGQTWIGAGAELILNGGVGTGTSTILSDSSNIMLAGGTLRLRGDKKEVLGTVTLQQGVTTVTRDLTAGGQVALGSLVVNSGGALLVDGLAATTTLSNGASNILGGWAAYDRQTWAVVASGGGEQNIEGYSGTFANSFGASNHLSVQSNLTSTGASAATLNFRESVSDRTISVDGILNLTEGGIMVTRGAGDKILTLAPSTSPTLPNLSLRSATDQIVVHQFNEVAPLIIDVPLNDNSGLVPTSLVKTGKGTLILSATNSHTGVVTIGQGTIQLGDQNGSTGDLTLSSTVPVVNNGILTFFKSTGTILPNPISGTGALRQIGSGNVQMPNSNTYTGRTSVQFGTLTAAGANALGSPLGGTAIEADGELILASASAEPIAIKNGVLTVSSLFSGPLSVFGSGSRLNVNTASIAELRTSLRTPFQELPSLLNPSALSMTFNDFGSGIIKLQGINSIGNVNVKSGRLMLSNLPSAGISGFIPGGSNVNLGTASAWLEVDVLSAHRMVPNNLSGAGNLRILSNPIDPTFLGTRQVWLTGNNTYSGETLVGSNISGAQGTAEAVLHVGADSFSGSIGTSSLTVESSSFGNSQVRTHRYDTLEIAGDVTLLPSRNANGTSGQNADFVKEGMGNVILSGVITSGPLGPKFLVNQSLPHDSNTNPFISGPERALFTVNSGRLVFSDATLNGTTNSWVGDESGPGPIAINNNAHIEFNAGDDLHTYSLFGALGGGGTWVFNSPGTVRLRNEAQIYEPSSGTFVNARPFSGWSGFALVHKGMLETTEPQQFGGALDIYLSSAGKLSMSGDETLEVISSARDATIEIGAGATLRLTGGERFNAGFLSGGGNLVMQGSTTNLYSGGNDYAGYTEINNNGLVRATKLAPNGQESSIGSGSDLFFGLDTTNGTLEFIGSGNDTTNRTMTLAGLAGTSGTVQVNGPGTLALTGPVEGGLTGLDGNGLQLQHTFNLAGDSVGTNVFSGNIVNSGAATSMILRKAGSGTWRMTGNRATFAGPVQLSGGVLEIDDIGALGNLAVARTVNLNGGTLRRYDNAVSGTETLPANVTFLSTGGNSGIINDDLNAALVISGSIAQDTSTGASTATRTITLGGNSGAANIVSGSITGNNLGLSKSGSSTWTLTGNNTFQQGGTISGGTLVVNGTGGLGNLGNYFLSNSDAVFDAGSSSFSRIVFNISDTIGSLQGNYGSKVEITNPGHTLTLQAGSQTFAGLITGAGGIKVTTNTNGAGRVATFTQKNTYSGPTSIMSDVGSNIGGNRIDVYHLANGGQPSGIGQSGSAASNLTIATKTGNGGLRFIGFSSQSTDRLFTFGDGSGGSGEGSVNIWADGQGAGNNLPTIRFTNTGALAYTGSGARRLVLRGGNRGTVSYNALGDTYVGTSFNEFSPIIADGPGGSTSLRKLEDSVWLLKGANTYTGAVSVERGTLSISHNTALGTSAGGVVVAQGSSDTRAFLDLRGVTVTDEALQINSIGSNNSAVGWGASFGNNLWTGTVANNISSRWGILNDRATPLTQTVLRVNGAISGGAAISTVGNGTLIFGGSNTFTGQITVANKIFGLDYATNNDSKLPNDVALILGGAGNVAVQGSSLRGQDGAYFQTGSTIQLMGGSHTEVVNGLTLSTGASYIDRIGGTSVLQMGAISRGAVGGGTLDVDTGATTTTTALTNNIVGGYLTVDRTDWATKTGNSILAFSAYDSSNLNVTSSSTFTDAGANTLRFNTASSLTVTLANDYTITSGGILVTPNVGANQVIITGSALTSGTGLREIIAHQHNTSAALRINSVIQNNGGTTVALTKSGLGELILTGNNTYTAGTFLNEGTLRVGENGSSATLGTGTLTVNGRLIFDHSGAEYTIGNIRGNGVIEFAQTNNRTVVFSGDSSGFNGEIILGGGTLASNADGLSLGSGRSIIRVTTNDATLDLRNTNANSDGNRRTILPELYLAGRLMTSVGTSTFGGNLFITDDLARIENAPGTALTINNQIYSSVGITKIGNGRLILNNGNLFADAIEGTTGRNINPNLTGQILVEAGELWTSGGGRSAGATGVGNEIIVSSGATIDLRDADFNYGDDPDANRKWIIAQGDGFLGRGALKNTAGTANVTNLEVTNDITIGTGGFFNGSRIDFNAYDTALATGSVLAGVTNLTPSKVTNSQPGTYNIKKVGTGDLVFRDTQFDSFNLLEIKEGELRFERNTPPHVTDSGLDTVHFNQIVLNYTGPSELDSTLLSSNTGPVVGSRLEFYRQNNVHHLVPIILDGDISNTNGGANYVELNSDASVPGPATFLDGGIQVFGPTYSNIFNVDGGPGTGSIAAQGNQTSEVQGKLVIGNGIFGMGGISKIGFRELRLTDENGYSGETTLTRTGTINVPSRSDTVTVNGVAFQTLGEAESWGEFGTTLTGNGRISGSSALRLERNALLTLDNSTRLDASSNTTTDNHDDRIRNAANIFMRMGTIRIIGSATESNAEQIASAGGAKLQLLAGTNMIDLWNSDGANLDITLTIGELSRSAGSVLRVRALDATTMFSTQNDVGNGDSVRVALTTAPTSGAGLAVVGGASGTSRSIVTGLLGGTAPHTIYADTRLITDLYAQGRNLQNATGSHFMTYDNGYLRPLDDSEYYVPTNGLVETAGAGGTNVNLTDFNHFTRTTTNINSLRFGPAADHDISGGVAVNTNTNLTSYTNNWQPTLYIDDSASLNIESGMISSATFGVGPSPNNTSLIRGGTINFGSREGIINNQNYWLRLTDGVYGSNNFEIQSRIAGSGGLTKVGALNIVLDAANTYTGMTTINEGVLFARNGRNSFGANGAGNGILVQGTGDFRLTNGVIIGTAAAPKDLTIGLIVNDGQQILRSENGNNYFYGDLIYDNVDSVLHANPAARPRVTANTNQALTIVGDIYGGTSLVTEDTYYTDSRIITLEGAGFINIRGQVGDRGVGGVAHAIEKPITAGRSSATLTNENQVFRLHIASNQDLNVTLDKQYNAAGRLALDQGVLIINYDPAAPGNDGAGFWTTEAITKLAGIPVAAAQLPVAPALADMGNSNSNNYLYTTDGSQKINEGNNGTSMHGFGMGALNIGAGNQAVFMTKPGQKFNMGTWTIGGGGGYAILGGLNNSGAVTYGTGQGTLGLGGRSVRFYASSGGEVDFNYRLSGGSFIKNGLGTVVIKNTAVDADITNNSDTHTFEIAGGTLVVDMDGAMTVRRVGNAGTFTGAGGTLIGRAFSTGTTATNRTVDISTDGGATRTVRFLGGNTQVIAQAIGVNGMTVTLGNGGNSSAVTRSEGATASFVGYNSTPGGTGVGEVRMNFATGIAHQNPKNHVIPWAVVSAPTGAQPRTAVDFAMVDGNASNRVRAFFRATDEYKNDVASWLIGEDVSEDTLTSSGGSGFRGTLGSSLAVNTIRFDAAASSTMNVGTGHTLQVAQGGIMVSSNTGSAIKTITGGRLTSSTIVAGRLTSGSNLVTDLASTEGLYVGMPVSGTSIPIGTFIQEILPSGTEVRLSSNASATTVTAFQGIVFGTTELIMHQYGKGDLVIGSGLGDGNSFIGGLATTSGSPVISLTTTLGITPGMVVVGPNIPSGATVVTIDSATSLTLSLPATDTATGGTLELLPLRTGPASVAQASYGASTTTVTVATTAPVSVGMIITGPGIPFGTTVAAVNSGTQLTLSNPTTASASSTVLYVTTQNDTPGAAVTVSGGSSTLDSPHFSVSSTTSLRVGMAITGTGIPANSVIMAIPAYNSADPANDTTTFTISQNATVNASGQTYTAVAGAVNLSDASTSSGSPTITVPSTTGLIAGMPVRLPHIPDNATVNTIPTATTFTISGGNASQTASGLKGYAQHPANMPAVLTGGVTSTGPGMLRLITVHSTAGLKPGYTVVGPNIPSGTVVEEVVQTGLGAGTQFVVTKDVTASGTGLTFVVGTQSAMPISMLAAEVRSGVNKVMVASTAGLQEGLILIGSGIPAAAVVTSVDSSQGFTMSVNATGNFSGGIIRAVSPMALTINGPSTTGEGEAGTTGAVVLKSSSGNYGGKTYINGGVLSISSEDSLGIASAVGTNDQLTLNGGTLRWTGINGQMNPNRGLTIGGNGGVIEIAESTGHLFIRRSIFSQDQYRGDLIKTGPGTLIFEGDNGDQSNFRGLLDIREGTVRMAGDRPDTAAGTSTMFGSNISWADGTLVRNNANLMIQFGNANDSGDYNIEEFITFEGNNGLTVGTPNGARRPVNWNGPMRINGPVTMDVTLGQIFRLGLNGGYVEGSGDIIKDGTGTLEFRENIPDWKGGLTILQGRVIGLNQADVFGTGHLNGRSITLGSTEHAGDADLFLQSDLGTAGSVWEVNMPINVVYNPAQTKRLGVTTQPNPGGMDFLFNGNITLNDNLVLNYTDTNGATPAGGEIVHMTYNGNISDGTVTSGNLILQTREGNGTTDANGNTNGRFYVYHRFAGNNSAWTGDLVVSDNLTYNHDQNTIARFDAPQAIGALNDVIMNYNSMLQVGGNNITIGALHTLGGNGPFASNVGTLSASQGHSSEVIENGGATPGTLTISQTTPATTEVKWDAMFRDGNLASHWISPGQSAAAASLNLVKAGEGWATLSLDNDYTGTTTVQTGILQVGAGGIGDTGAVRALNAAGLTLNAGATLAGTGVVQGAAVLNGLLRPGDVAGEAIGTININGNVALGDTSVTTIQVQSAALNVPELMSVPLAGNGPDVNNAGFLSAYALLRNMSLGITDADSATYQKELSDPVYGNHHDQVRSSGEISLSNDARIALALEGYTPVAGDVFRVLQAASITAAAGFNVGSQFRYGGESGLDLELPSLGGSFMWDTSLFKTRGIVSVVGIDNGEAPTVLAPIFLTRPQHVIVPLNGMATYTTSAFGAGTISYAWKKGTTQVGTGESLTVGPVTPSMVTKYSVTATNSVGSSTSGPVELAALNMSGSSSYLQAGGTKTLTTVAYASSATVLKYQWYKDGIALSNSSKYAGVTTKTLTLKAFSSSEAGNYTCRVSIPASAVSGAAFLDGGVHQVLLLSKPEFETDVNGALSPLPPSGNVSGAYGPYTVPMKPGVNRAPTKFTATGLPTGVTINATTGVLSGTPDLDKTWTNIKITASNAAGSTTCQPFSIVIAPLPNTAVGAFVALMDRDATAAPTISFGKGARIDLTTAKKGTFTLKFTNGTTAHSATGRLSNLGGAPTASVLVKRKAPLANLTVTFSIGVTDPNKDLVTGTVTDGVTAVNPGGLAMGATTNNFNGWRNVWSLAKGAVNEATTRYGSHNVKAEFTNQDVFPTAGADIGDLTKPQGATTAIMKVVKPGNVTTVMKMGDSTAVASIAAPLGPTGQVLIYKTLYSSKQQGTVHGQASIAADAAHTTTGSMTWSKPAPATTTVAKLYHNGWPAAPLALTIGGGLYIAPLALKPPTVPVGEIVMSLPAQPNNAQLNFEYGKVETASNYGDLDIPFTVASTAKVTIPAYNVNGVPSNPNPATLKMTTLNAATGEFAGTATMRDIDTNTSKPVTRTLTYRGLIIPNVNTGGNLKDGIGVGWFTLRELPIVSPEIQNAGVVTFDVAP